MKISPFRLVGICGGLFAVFAAGFLSGGRYASVRAARESNAASLIYFTGIHDALNRERYDWAAQITNTAVDGHINVLGGLHDHPWLASEFYTFPWMPSPGITSAALLRVHKSYDAHPEQLRPETLRVLAAER